MTACANPFCVPLLRVAHKRGWQPLLLDPLWKSTCFQGGPELDPLTLAGGNRVISEGVGPPSGLDPLWKSGCFQGGPELAPLTLPGGNRVISEGVGPPSGLDPLADWTP